MVKCILGGKLCDLGRYDYDDEEADDEYAEEKQDDSDDDLDRKYAPLKMQEEFERVVRNSKVTEEELDENGRPISKTVYVDPLDWNARHYVLTRRYMNLFSDSEKKAAGVKDEGSDEEGLNDEVKKEPPRLVFVLQDMDYWPGTESDPEAMARRLPKDLAYQQTGCCGAKPDYKFVWIASFVDGRRYSLNLQTKTRVVKKKVYSHPPPPVEGSSFGVSGTGDSPPKKKRRQT